MSTGALSAFSSDWAKTVMDIVQVRKMATMIFMRGIGFLLQ
jgi:hypothetical protein